MSQLYGVNRCLSEQPERALLGSVLEEAVETLAKHMGKPGGRSRKLVQDVLEWFETRGDEKKYFTCDYVCFALGLNADWFRREMRRALGRGIDVTPILRERRYT